MISLLLLICVSSLVSAMVTTTTEAPATPGPDATLQEVWDWMVSVAGSQDNGALNINMWMAGNKMSMQVGVRLSDCSQPMIITSGHILLDVCWRGCRG